MLCLVDLAFPDDKALNLVTSRLAATRGSSGREALRVDKEVRAEEKSPAEKDLNKRKKERIMLVFPAQLLFPLTSAPLRPTASPVPSEPRSLQKRKEKRTRRQRLPDHRSHPESWRSWWTADPSWRSWGITLSRRKRVNLVVGERGALLVPRGSGRSRAEREDGWVE